MCLAAVDVAIASKNQGQATSYRAPLLSRSLKPCACPNLLMVTTQASTLRAALRYGWPTCDEVETLYRHGRLDSQRHYRICSWRVQNAPTLVCGSI